MSKVQEIAKKWYQYIGFPKELDGEFTKILEQVKDLKEESLAEFHLEESLKTPGRTLLMYLYFCEELSEKYRERGIPEQILKDSLYDLVLWSKVHYALRGYLDAAEPKWLQLTLNFKLFRLGRLQYCPSQAYMDIPAIGVKKGDPIMEVHIPEGEPLDAKRCEESFALAEQFFKTYFPEVSYICYTCHSWLLDETLQKILKPESNIIKFGKMFTPAHAEESYALLKYIFDWDAGKENIESYQTPNSFSEKIKQSVLAGEKFYEVLGYIVR